jgi:hypothetical protein
MPAYDPAWQTGFAGMAQLAVFHRPGNLSIVAHPTEFTIDDSVHGNVIRSRPHFETQLMMTDFAAKTHPVEPMRKNNRSHALLLSSFVENHIAILCPCIRRYKTQESQ